ncbi:MAG: ATP-binding protein [Candidatus Cryptobacteroides sp.]
MKRKFLSDRTFGVIFTLGVLIVTGIILAIKLIPYGPDTAAIKVSAGVSRRVKKMDGYVRTVLESSTSSFIHFDDLPEDIVIYKYVDDTLQSWCNQFTQANDDISSKLVFARITNTPSLLFPPLAMATGELTYMNMGPKWYLVRSVKGKGGVTVVSGVEIKNSIIERYLRGKNGINPKLGLSPNYDVVPLTEDNGSAVMVEDRPVFKVVRSSVSPAKNDMGSLMFSPLVYADGPVLSSLGMLLLFNCLLFFVLWAVYHNRRKSMRLLYVPERRKRRLLIALYGLAVAGLIAGSSCYIFFTYRSFLLNSSLDLDVFRWSGDLFFSLLMIFSYIGLIMITLFQIFNLKVVIKEFTGRRLRLRSNIWPLVFALVTAGYISIANTWYGFQKEERQVWSWTDRLSIERDLSMEIQMLSVEEAIASDPVISTLVVMDNSDRPVRNRIAETYFYRISQNHDISVKVLRPGDVSGERLLKDVLDVSVRITETSHFFYNDSPDSRGGYYGLFLYWTPESKLVKVLLRVANNRETDLYGYKSILPRNAGLTSAGIPAFYSYAKYSDNKIKLYRGTFPYPTVSNNTEDLSFDQSGHCFFRMRGYDHFCSQIDEHEMVVISRPTRKSTSIFSAFSFMFLLSFCIIFLSRRRITFHRNSRNSLRTRINLLLLSSLFVTLATIAFVSIAFVSGRNESNLNRLMSNKINTVQSLLEKKCQDAESYLDLQTQEYYETISETARIVKTDITLYSPSGKVFSSTAPELFERMTFGSRLNQEAYYNIKVLSQRYFINKEELARNSYYALYAPIFNADGKMVAIADCPYTNTDYNLSREAIMHTFLTVCLFLLLLLLSIWMSSTVTENLFRKLMKLSRTMDSMDIHNLEEIDYQGSDEVSSLVEAYNKMVRELEASSRQLAKAERDSAWSEMARQVAHEIKNSLTPIKLKIQKLMRLRANGAPDWDEKFDETAKVILDHIDTLAETASGFSAIAKLYGEQATVVDVDTMLSEQAFMFDNREHIKIAYVGMPNAMVMAPQSQLMRVFINLITNAIQAIEMRRREEDDASGEAAEGKIMIALRNSSTRDDCYDIVVDDNGTGVAPEHLDKLFVPNFTTKSSGTGLGLSICRSIVESCNGTIEYSRSFALGGACFTVTLPKCHEKL